MGIDYVIRAGATVGPRLRASAAMGRRSPVNGQVSIPPRRAHRQRCALRQEVRSHSGVVTTFSVIRIEFPVIFAALRLWRSSSMGRMYP